MLLRVSEELVHKALSLIAECSDRNRMVSLGEMVSYLPLPGGHITMAERFVDSAWSFTLGWNYCTSLLLSRYSSPRVLQVTNIC